MELKELIAEYSRAGGYNDLAYRRTKADDVRFAVWAGHRNNLP